MVGWGLGEGCCSYSTCVGRWSWRWASEVCLGKRKCSGCYGNGFIFGSMKLCFNFSSQYWPVSLSKTARLCHSPPGSCLTRCLANRISPVSLMKSNIYTVHQKKQEKHPKLIWLPNLELQLCNLELSICPRNAWPCQEKLRLLSGSVRDSAVATFCV